MPIKRISNAATFHVALVAQTLKKIEMALRDAKRSRLQFKNVSGLAIYLADVTGHSAGNLRRSIAYRSLLEDFLVTQQGAVEFTSNSTIDNPALLKAKIYSLQVQNSNPQKSVQRLAKHNEKLTRVPGSNDTRALTPPESETGIDFQMAFECTAAVLDEVIRRSGFISVDLDKRMIIDKSARPADQEIAGPTRARWFVLWLSQSRKGK